MLVAGENVTLTCSISVIDGLVGDALVEAIWSDSNGSVLQPDSLQTNGRSTTTILEFSPLLLSHGGRYTCSASITISEVSVVRRNMEPFDVIIQSKYTITFICT